MPFDFTEYQQKCTQLSTEELHREWENYTRQLSGGATSTTTSVLFAPITGGISLLGLGLAAPRVHNARKKRQIIEAGLQARGVTHNTRKRDVVAPMAISGAISGLTLGLAGPGAELIAGEVVGHGVEYAASHAALEATGAALEHTHGKHHVKKTKEKMNAQYQSFQAQYIAEQRFPQGAPPQLMTSGHLDNLSTQFGDMQVTPPIPPHQPEQGHVPASSAPAAYNPQSIYPPPSYGQQSSFPPPPPLPQHQNAPLQSNQQTETTISALRNAPDPTSTGTIPLVSTYPQAPSLSVETPELSSPSKEELYDDGDDDEQDPPQLSLEEEIIYLKARLLQLEIEKREVLLKKSSSQDSKSNAEPPLQIQSPPDLEITVLSTNNHQTPQVYPPPPPPISTAPINYQPPTLQMQNFPPPPPSPNRQVQSYPPPPSSPRPQMQTSPQSPPVILAPQQYQPQNYAPALPARTPSPYQPQNYAIPPPPPGIPAQPVPLKSPTLQQQPYPQRQDSGYFSGPPTLSPASPHSNGPQFVAPSGSPRNATSPSSAPPPFFPPPPGATPQPGLGGKDYFSQGSLPPPPSLPSAIATNPNYSSTPGYQTANGWSWGSAGGEPNYGPPPPIPHLTNNLPLVLPVFFLPDSSHRML